MAGHYLFVTLDLSCGYHNLSIHPDDIEKFAIVIPQDIGLPYMHFVFLKMSFGLAAAPGVLPPKVKTPDNDLGNAVAVYLDDICLAPDNFEEMLPLVKALFNRIRAAGFLLKAKKCDLFQETVQYLGYTISIKGIELSKNKVERIRHWQAPTSLSELRNFVGFINFHQTHLKDFARLCQPFYRLFRKNVLFNWTPECQKNFDKLKDMASKHPFWEYQNWIKAHSC